MHVSELSATRPANEINRRRFLHVAGLSGLTLVGALTGCGLFDDESAQAGGAADGEGDDGGQTGPKSLRISFTVVDVLDPQVITNGMWILSRGILEGLVTQNSEGNDVVAATAESWDMSEDGLTYTFHIRDEARWSNGDAVTAHDFERTYQRLLTPSSGGTGGTTLGANSYQTPTGIKGAVEHLSGSTDDWDDVGIRALSERELEFTLESPNPDFLVALTHPAFLPLHMDTVEAEPDGWQEPPHFVSNGPYAVTEFVHNSTIELEPNEEYWDRGNVHLDRIEIQIIDPGASPGTLTVPYENDETDIVQIGDADVLRFDGDPELAGHLREVSTYSNGYLAAMRSEHPALEDVRVRKALSISLNRELIASVTPGSRPGVSLVHDQIEGWDEGLAVHEDVEEAKRLLAEAGYPDGQGLPQVRVLVGSESPIVDAIVDQWQENLGIDALPDRVEAGVYAERRWEVQTGDYIGFYWGTFAGLPTWPTYVGALWSPTDVQRLSLPAERWKEYKEVEGDEDLSSSERSVLLADLIGEHASEGALRFSEIVAAAPNELDEDRRLDMYKEAARLREDEYLFFSVVWLSSYFAVRPNITGLHLRRYPDFFYLKSLDIEA